MEMAMASAEEASSNISEINLTSPKRKHHPSLTSPPNSAHHHHLPKKRFYRARAHSNPLSDSHFPVPINPAHFDWYLHFPAFFPPPHFPSQNPNPQPPSQNPNPQSTLQNPQNPNLQPTLQNPQNPIPQPTSQNPQNPNPQATPTDPESTSDHSNGLPKVRFADVGCGFGGLLVRLSVMFPQTLMLGMELRDKVTEYVKERINALRIANPGSYHNISVIRTNAMKYLPNFFEKGQLQKMFFLFPDPHFKEKNHRRRIITVALLAEYAYVLGIGGVLYTITDVEELGEWMRENLEAHPLFERLSEEELKEDPVVELLISATEEGQKVARNNGQTFCSVYRRMPAK